jgi:hypothetical protein
MRVNNENLLDESGPLDASVNQNLPPVWLGHIMHYSVQLVVAGSPAGTFKLQASNDPGRINSTTSSNQVPITNWTDLSISTTISAAGTVLLRDSNCGYNWVRVVWTPSSGTGSITSARAYVKGI